MTPEDLSSLLEAMQELEPIYDAAEGQKAELERRGWSPAAAESVALELLVGMVRMVFRGASK